MSESKGLRTKRVNAVKFQFEFKGRGRLMYWVPDRNAETKNKN